MASAVEWQALSSQPFVPSQEHADERSSVDLDYHEGDFPYPAGEDYTQQQDAYEDMYEDDEELDSLSGWQLDLIQLELAVTRALVKSGAMDSLSPDIPAPTNLSETLNIVFALAKEESDSGGIEALLQSEGLWSLVEQIEAKVEAEEMLIEVELQIQEELAALENVIEAEEEAVMHEMLSDGDSSAPSEGKQHPSQRDAEIAASLPLLQKDPVMRRRYAKYRAFSNKPPPKPYIYAAKAALNEHHKATSLRAAAPPIVVVTPIRPPHPPTKADLTRASWARPDCSARPTGQRQQALRRAFVEAHTAGGPRRAAGNRPPPPPPPDPPCALTACPFPGAPLIAHQLRLRGLPMRCAEADVLHFLGPEHAARVMADWNEDGFKAGVKLLRRADGWLTGEAVVKFQDKRAALHALPDAHGRRLGRRRVEATYVRLPPRPNRGRILVAGIKGKTSSRDLAMHFRGWDLAGDAAGAPEVVTDRNGVPTGEAIVVFASEAAAARALAEFDFERPLDGRRLRPRPLPPVEWDEVDDSWVPVGADD